MKRAAIDTEQKKKNPRGLSVYNKSPVFDTLPCCRRRHKEKKKRDLVACIYTTSFSYILCVCTLFSIVPSLSKIEEKEELTFF